MWKTYVPHDCKVHGHRFEARYDEQPNPAIVSLKGGSAREQREMAVLNLYVLDICVRCGETRSRSEGRTP